MNSDLYFDGKKYISSSRAAKISGYVNDYIGQLCRDGKLECRMIGRSWYVSFDSLIAHKNANGVLGKTKAQKINRKHASIKEEKQTVSTVNFEAPLIESQTIVSDAEQIPVVLQKKQEDGKTAQNIVEDIPLFVFDLKAPKQKEENTNPLIKNIESNTSIQAVGITGTPTVSKVDSSEHTIKINTASVVSDKASIPAQIVADKKIEYFSRPTFITPITSTTATLPLPVTHHELFGKKFPKVALGVLSLFIAFLGFEFMTTIPSGISHITQANKTELSLVNIDLTASVAQRAFTIFNNLSEEVYLTVNNWTTHTETVILTLIRKNDSPLPLYTDDPPIMIAEEKPHQGMVVVPVTAKTDKEATIAKIKNTFSDEVSVEPSVRGDDGVIRPVFKKGNSDDYLYVLVPINN